MKQAAGIWNAMGRKKGVEASVAEGSEAARHLKWYDLTAFGIATTVGSGIYVTCGLVARDVTGPAVVLSTAVAGILSLLTGLCYLEFASALPVAGSGYAYFYALVGEFAAFFVGWCLTLEYSFAAAAIAGGWTAYLVTLLEAVGLPLPRIFYDVPLLGMLRVSAVSAAIVLAVGAAVGGSARLGARVTNGVTAVNVLLIAFIVVVGATRVVPANWTPFAPGGTASILHGAGEMFFSFLGFDTVTTLAGDAKHPGRDIPVAMLATIASATALYMAVGVVLTGMQPATALDATNPLARAFRAAGVPWAGDVVSVCALSTMTLTIFTSLVGQTKIFAAMARDGLLPRAMAEPAYGIAATVILTASLALFFDVRSGLIEVISFGCMVCMTAVCVAVLGLRFSGTERPRVLRIGRTATGAYCVGAVVLSAAWHSLSWPFVLAIGVVGVVVPFVVLCWTVGRCDASPRLSAPFHCPAVPLVPAAAILANAFVMLRTSWRDMGLFAAWAAIGVAVYFTYGIRNAKLAHFDDLEVNARHALKDNDEASLNGQEVKEHAVNGHGVKDNGMNGQGGNTDAILDGHVDDEPEE
jgi:APA family basic amino acid/polyamine antiporter